MRIAVLADIHGNTWALEAVLKDLKTWSPDLVLNLGDCFSGPLSSADTAQILLGLDWPTVRGNHDRYLLETERRAMGPSDAVAYDQLPKAAFEWLRGLPGTLDLPEGIFAFHGTPGDDERYLLETVDENGIRMDTPKGIQDKLSAGGSYKTGGGLALCGHSHLPRIVRIGRTTILNPGSVGLQAYNDDTPFIHYSETGGPHARYAILDRDRESADEWRVSFRALEYDWDAAAALAMKNLRDEWAYALAWGFAKRD